MGCHGAQLWYGEPVGNTHCEHSPNPSPQGMAERTVLRPCGAMVEFLGVEGDIFVSLCHSPLLELALPRAPSFITTFLLVLEIKVLPSKLPSSSLGCLEG